MTLEEMRKIANERNEGVASDIDERMGTEKYFKFCDMADESIDALLDVVEAAKYLLTTQSWVSSNATINLQLKINELESTCTTSE